MSHHIRPLRKTAPDYAAFASIVAAEPATVCDFEYGMPEEVRDFVESFAGTPHAFRCYLVEDGDGRAIGYGFWFSIPWLAEPGRYWLAARVLPERRREGIGRALLDRLRADLRALRPAGLRAMVAEVVPDVADLVRRLGFRELLRTVPYTLAVRRFDDRAFEVDRARFAGQGMVIATLDELRARDPEWLPKLFALHLELNREVPIPNQAIITRRWFARFAAQLPEGFFVALDGDRYVGESFVHPAEDEPGQLRQQVTGVLGEYRGRGIAMALKLRTIDFARERGYRTIRTWVESSNGPMLAINRRLGFEPGAGCILFEGELLP